MKERPFRLALIFAVIAFLASLIMIPYQLQIISLPEAAPVHPAILFISSAVQTALITLLLSYLGIRLSAPVGLQLSIWKGWAYRKEHDGFENRNVLLAILGGIIVSLAIATFDQLLFVPSIPQLQVPESSHWLGLTTIFYGGIVEELMLRLGLMTLFVWLFYRLFGKKTRSWMYIVAILLTSVLFGLGHLPATIQAFGELTSLLVIRAILLNALGGILFGWLYWKKGLEYAMIAHMAGDLMLHVILA
ncbi:abortive infection protein [Brevibacillus reuszeri]|uniref:Abortive infection protein n=1 Tax=Brevibacillus reuszeri TaxID=54915 RepID=A0ABQ0TUX6_9BACL|nr:CPBP family intramembrane glutamic endopeptidase [Brevibacillus reuszeri]MED1860148.1 CPBP family intramembrane metalloprotease [Brevibacillus reuszeri]GED71655.1 abortive infection protein [Brevibacillus reuszeri]